MMPTISEVNIWRICGRNKVQDISESWKISLLTDLDTHGF